MSRIAADQKTLSGRPKRHGVFEGKSLARLEGGGIENLNVHPGFAVVKHGAIGQDLRRREYLLMKQNDLVPRGRYPNLPVFNIGLLLKFQFTGYQRFVILGVKSKYEAAANEKTAVPGSQDLRNIRVGDQSQGFDHPAIVRGQHLDNEQEIPGPTARCARAEFGLAGSASRSEERRVGKE